MTNRADTKHKHETAVLNAAVAEHNKVHGLSLSVTDRPDPPDAILSDGKFTTWLEVTDAFFSSEWAKDLFSHASSETHKPMHEGGYAEPDAQIASNFCSLVLQKAGKDSYAAVLAAHGPGILVVGLESPWLSASTIDAINREWAARGSPNISATFQYVYLGYRQKGDNHATIWLGT